MTQHKIVIRTRFLWFFRLVAWVVETTGMADTKRYASARVSAWMCEQAWRVVRFEQQLGGRWHRLPGEPLKIDVSTDEDEEDEWPSL